MIKVRNITKKYGATIALQDVTLAVKKGKTVALIGPSGCGKSTLLRIMLGLVEPDSGQVEINEALLSKESALEIRQQVGYVIQKGGLFPHLTAYQNCALLPKHLKTSKDEIEERLQELCDLTGIEIGDLSKYPSQFSGGQQQRISLMRALMMDPPILLLDEPLGSIDPLVRYDLQSDLKDIFKRLNKTVVLVTHDLGEAGFLGDEIVLMNQGQIIQKGTIQSIVKHPNNEFVSQFVKAQRNHLEEIE
ncbi:MAG: ATP-binding cassette domain-containing protein [Balneolaceae bacterium]|nr:ATP-binding cassette domain-containing protein [Balneolaceae bacterium]